MTCSKATSPGERFDALDALRILVLRPLGEDFLGAVQAGQRFGNLRADRHHLEHGRHQESQERGEGHHVAHRHALRHGEVLAGPHVHHRGAHHTHKDSGREAHQRNGREAFQHVIQQALHAAREDAGLLGLGVVALDHADSGERFREPPRDIGRDYGAFAENGADLLERGAQCERKQRDEQQRQAGEQWADAQQKEDRADGRQNAAGKFHQSGADEVADAFHVAHDARHQHARFVGVVIAYGQAADVFLNAAAQLRDQPLRFLGKQLGEREGRDALHDGGAEHREHQRLEQVRPVLADDVIDQVLGGRRQHQPAQPVDHHEHEAQRQQAPPRADQILQQWKDAAQMVRRFPFRI